MTIPKKNPIRREDSDHDERDEGMAVEKHWDQESNDPLAVAEQRVKQFQKNGVPISDEDWEKEEKNDDEIPDHIDAAVDKSVSLEALAEEEMGESEEEE